VFEVGPVDGSLSISASFFPHSHAKSKTYGERFIAECIEERTQNLIRIIDLLGVFSEDPDERRFGFWFI
jgi:hypothetical protein